MSNPIFRYDFTINGDFDRLAVVEILKEYCKKWVFQLEKGEVSGLLHLQGRLSLLKKTRESQLYKLIPGWHFSPTSTACKGFDYVMKEATRVEGPWKDSDKPVYIPRDIRAIERLLPWQESLLEIVKVYNQRDINIVYDPDGNSGKSTFVRYCMCYGYGQILPFVNDYKDIMRMVMDMPESKCYLMDMPRAIDKKRLFQLMAGVETVKGGYCYDDRYKFKQKMFDPPVMVLFTNVMPERDMLSKDRWKIWSIEDKKLVKYVEPIGDAADNDLELGGFLGARAVIVPETKLASLGK